MKKTTQAFIIATASLLLGTITVNSHNSFAHAKSSAMTIFKQQSTDDAKVATKKSISKLNKSELNNFIPTEAMKINGNFISDPGSNANFVTKVNYKAEKKPNNKINLPKGYTIKTLKFVAKKQNAKNYSAQIKMGKIGLQGLALNSFTPSKSDLTRSVDLNHVTYKQNRELTNFALQLINPVIKKAGGIQFKSSQNAINAAQATADVYSKDNWNNTGKKYGHDERAQKVVSKKFNIKQVAEENYTDNPSLALTDQNLKTRKVSMAALKHALYNSMAIQLFEDGPSYWGYATAIMNLDIHKKYQPNYLGVAFDKFGGLHFFMIPHSNKVNKSFNIGLIVK